MNSAIWCIEDTLRLLVEEANQAKEMAASKRGSPEEGFEVGRAEGLAEALHTWANQLETFGLDAEVDGACWEELRVFLTNQGFGQKGTIQAISAESGIAADRPRV